MRCGASSSVTSTASVSMRSGLPIAFSRAASLFASRPTPSTAMPASANLTAVPKPMPLLAPVMIATCMSPLRLRICDAHIRRFQPAGNGDQDLRTLQQQMRVRFIAEADAAVTLDVLAGVLDRRGAGDDQGGFHLPPTPE